MISRSAVSKPELHNYDKERRFGQCGKGGGVASWVRANPRGRERNLMWLLKNSFHGISTIKFVCKLLNVRWPQTLKFTEITALVPFSTATDVFASLTQTRMGGGCIVVMQIVKTIVHPDETRRVFLEPSPTKRN
jgi:hypothetical protein